MTKTTDATSEIGQPDGLAPNYSGAWGAVRSPYLVDTLEANEDLQFPQSVEAYRTMGDTSTKVGGILRAIRLRVQGLDWALDGAGVRPEVLAFVQEQVGLAPGGRTRRTHGGIVFKSHLGEALSCLQYGFAAFEQVYSTAIPETPAEVATGMPTVLRLRKLGVRDQRTVTRIGVDADGGLAELGQTVLDPTTNQPVEVSIPVSVLVMYVNDQQGADWYGRSMLREAYRPWFFVDKLERLQAQIIERNGMGVPIVTYDPTMDGAQTAAERLASRFRAGATAGGSVPVGSAVTLVGVSGSTVDPLPTIQHHDQAMGKAMMAMFMDLGHDAGARSLGDTFVDLFNSALDAVAANIADVFTEHVIRDLVALNFGDTEPYPVLVSAPASANMGLSADTLKVLAESGAVTFTPTDEAFVRRRYGLPERAAVAAPTSDSTLSTEPGEDAGRLAMDDALKSAQVMGTQVGTAKGLIQSGFDPMASMAAVGLDPVKHMGLLPVTVQRPPTTDGDMPDGTNVEPEADAIAPPAAPGMLSSLEDDPKAMSAFRRALRFIGGDRA